MMGFFQNPTFGSILHLFTDIDNLIVMKSMLKRKYDFNFYVGNSKNQFKPIFECRLIYQNKDDFFKKVLFFPTLLRKFSIPCYLKY